MKGTERFRGQFGSNTRESMGIGAGEGVPAIGPSVPAVDPRIVGCSRAKGAMEVSIDRVVPDENQPRKEFDQDAIDRLALSLKERGQLQPIRVRWDARQERWVIIAGERRWRAALAAGLKTVLAVEAAGALSDRDILLDQLIENCLREDLKPIEQAKAFKAILDAEGLSARELADTLRVSASTIIKAVSLLNLPDTVQEAVEQGALASSAAYELTRLAPEDQERIALTAQKGKLTRSEIQAVVRQELPVKPRSAAARAKREPWQWKHVDGKGRKLIVTFPEAPDSLKALVAFLKDALAEAQSEAKNRTDSEAA